MRQKKLIRLLLSPSVLSGFITLLVTLSYSLTVVWKTYSGYPVIRDYVDSIAKAGKQITEEQGSTDAFFSSVLSSPKLNNLLIIVFWALAGLLAYTIVVTILSWTKGTVSAFTSQNFYMKNTRAGKVIGLVNRASIRTIAGISWLIYFIVYLRFIIPISIGNLQIATSLGWIENWYFVVIAVLMLLLTTHLHTVFVRLLFLKPRLFDSNDALVAESK